MSTGSITRLVTQDVRTLIERLDTLLDAIPIYEDGRWWRYGDWGCRLQLHRLWWRLGE